MGGGDGRGEGWGEGQHTKPYNKNDFEMSLFDCMESPSVCLLSTCCLMCVTNKMTAENIGENGLLYLLLSMPCINCLGMILLRMKVREFYGITENLGLDVLLGLCCPACSSCEMYNETILRGVGMEGLGSSGGLTITQATTATTATSATTATTTTTTTTF